MTSLEKLIKQKMELEAKIKAEELKQKNHEKNKKLIDAVAEITAKNIRNSSELYDLFATKNLTNNDAKVFAAEIKKLLLSNADEVFKKCFDDNKSSSLSDDGDDKKSSTVIKKNVIAEANHDEKIMRSDEKNIEMSSSSAMKNLQPSTQKIQSIVDGLSDNNFSIADKTDQNSQRNFVNVGNVNGTNQNMKIDENNRKY